MNTEEAKGKIFQFERALELKRPLIPRTPVPLTITQEQEMETARQTVYCPRCHLPIDEFTYGWIKDPTGRNPKGIPCPECSPERIANRRRRDNERKLKKLFGGSNIPQRAIEEEWCFETLPPGTDPRATHLMQSFATGKAFRRVYLLGAYGHGKTGLAVCAAREFIKRDEQVLYLSAREYFQKIRDNLFTKEMNGEQVDIVVLAHTVKVLILDDLGVEKPTDFVLERLYALVEERRNDLGLYTVITSNYSTEALAQRFLFHDRPLVADDQPGFRVAERLDEDFMVIEVKGQKLRKGLDMSKFGSNGK